MASRFVEAGANVVITSRTAEDLADAAAGLVAAGAPVERVAWVAAHVGRPDDAKACIAETVARFRRPPHPGEQRGDQPVFRPHDRHRPRQGAEDVRGEPALVLLWTAEAVRAGLRGSVINVASVGGLGVEPNIGWYNVTKAARPAHHPASFELAPDVHVNALGLFSSPRLTHRIAPLSRRLSSRRLGRNRRSYARPHQRNLHRPAGHSYSRLLVV